MRPLVPICAALVLSAAACTGSSGPSSESTPSSAATTPGTSSTPSTPSVASPTTDASPTPSPTSAPATQAAGAPACTTPSLKLHAAVTGAAAGTDYISLVVTNVGSGACSLFGYPGASFLDGDGRQLGLPAERDGSSKKKRLVVQPGDKAHAVLSYPNPGVFGSGCGEAQAKAVRFYPPDRTEPLQAPVEADVCTQRNGRSSVGAMQPGTRGF